MEQLYVTFVGLVPDLALSILFAVFIIKVMEMNQSNSKRIMDDWSQRLDTMNKSWQDFVAQQNSANRQAQADSTARLAEEVKRNTETLAGLTNTIVHHDDRAAEMQRKIDAMAEKQPTQPRKVTRT